MLERLSVEDQKKYQESLRTVVDLKITDPMLRIPARISAYYYQAKMGARTTRQVNRKIAQYLDRQEKMHPEAADYFLTPLKGSKLNLVMTMRNQIIPPEMWATLDAESAQKTR